MLRNAEFSHQYVCDIILFFVFYRKKVINEKKEGRTSERILRKITFDS